MNTFAYFLGLVGLPGLKGIKGDAYPFQSRAIPGQDGVRGPKVHIKTLSLFNLNLIMFFYLREKKETMEIMVYLKKLRFF